MGHSDWPGLGGTPLSEGLGEVRWAGHRDLHTKIFQSSGDIPPRNNRCHQQAESSMPPEQMQQLLRITGQVFLHSLFFFCSQCFCISLSLSFYSFCLICISFQGCCPHAQHRQWRSPGNFATAIHKDTFGRQWLQMALSYSGAPCPRAIDAPLAKGHSDPVK